ncbi:uncharacterized protein Dana_GF16704, isoform B [Drosophila ananassae]|uniref:Uncharacterized protein, isoform B n=1 Tax=Drosophila ananassae TaxID=7217 RepID=A0A0P8XZR7_DROAN|nr:uncharacterized protein Dana_GF16704, isoform B [Drosophila ananassae]
MNAESADTIEPASQEISPFLKQLESVENMLHRMENYTRRLNHQINDLKCVTEANRQVIARLQNNGNSMKSLLDDEQEQLKTQASQLLVVKSLNSGMSLNMVDLGKDFNSIGVDLKEVCHHPTAKENNHLCETCEVTNIRQISWTHCKPTTDEGMMEKVENPNHLVEMHRETVALLNSLKSDLDRKNARQEYRRKNKTISNLNRQQQLIQRVYCKDG